MLDGIEQITIVGTGLLGTSLALALKEAGYSGSIVGHGRRQETLEKAMAVGGFDRVTTDVAAAYGGESDDGQQLVIVAIPVGAFAATFEAIAQHAKQGTMVTDVGSTKSNIQRLADELLPVGVHFVGSHPMAGSEQQGPEHAEAGLFKSRPCIVTPTEAHDGAALEMVTELWQGVGMKVLTMSPNEHDRQTAAISHLPHLVATVLVDVANDLGGWDIASTGFRDTTRLASSNPKMRADIIMENREHLIEAARCFIEKIEAFVDHLEEVQNSDSVSDDEALNLLIEQQLAALKERREKWSGQFG